MRQAPIKDPFLLNSQRYTIKEIGGWGGTQNMSEYEIDLNYTQWENPLLGFASKEDIHEPKAFCDGEIVVEKVTGKRYKVLSCREKHYTVEAVGAPPQPSFLKDKDEFEREHFSLEELPWGK